MDPIIETLPIQYDTTLLALAAAFAVAAGFVTVLVFSHLAARSGGGHFGWLALAALSAGAGSWTAHLLTAFSLEVGARSYDAATGGMALAAALLSAAIGLALARLPGSAMAAVGGAIVGLGAAATHFLGMTGLGFNATPVWSPAYLGAAAVLGAVLGGGAMLVFRAWPGARGLLVGSGLMALAIIAGLGGVTAAFGLLDEPPQAPPRPGVDETLLMLGAMAATATVLIAGLVAALLDGRSTRTSLARISQVLEAAGDGLILADAGAIIHVNKRVSDLSGRAPGKLAGKRVHGDLLSGRARAASGSAVVGYDAKLFGPGDQLIPVHVSRRGLEGVPGVSEVYALRDLRERQQAAERIDQLTGEMRRMQADMRQRNILLEHVLGNMTQGLCLFDAEQRVVIANELYATIYGLPPEAVAPGTHLRDIVQMRIDKGLFAGGSPAAYMQERLAPIEKAGDLQQELSDGRIIAIHQRPMPTGGWISIHEDVTERLRMEAENLQLTEQDTLTLLPNRSSIRKLLSEMLEGALRKGRRLAVLLLNLDHFREVNNAFGHEVGDMVLRAVADRLRGHIRRATLLARLGDDEFVLIEAVDQPGRDASALATRIQEQLRQPFKVEGGVVTLDSTVGIAIAPADGKDGDLLLKRADLALAYAKRTARGSHQFFVPTMEKQLKERMNLEQELAAAVRKSALDLCYQPMVNLSRNEISGFEAVLRWDHPVRGPLSSDVFLPVAEEAGLMPAIGEWALREACTEAAGWPERLKLAMRITPSQFRAPDFVRIVISTLSASGMPAHRLELEIPEKVLEENEDYALTTLHQLSEPGVGITVDDFGWGLSALTGLRRFPFHRVKVGRAFLGGLEDQSDALATLRILAKLGASFGVTSSVDGVETQHQFDLLRAEGYTEIQGPYFSPPRTAAEIRKLFLSKSDSAVA